MNLLEQTNSNYVQGENILHKRQEILVYVENEIDVPFWKHIFNKYKLKTLVTASTNDKSLIRGKDNVLSFADRAGKFLLLCVDSDYDYLLQNSTKKSKLINENPYIFQTYAYSIENYKCFAESLGQLITEATLQDADEIFDYEAFMQAYSQIVYELFLYSFYYERENQQREEAHKLAYPTNNTLENTNVHSFEINEFCKIVSFEKIDVFEKGTKELEALQESVKTTLVSLPAIPKIDELKQELATLGIIPENVYFFINGHTIQNNVVLMILKPIAQHLATEKRKDIAQTEAGKQVKEDKHKEYNKHTKDIAIILQTHKHYEKSPLFDKILTDVGKFLETPKK